MSINHDLLGPSGGTGGSKQTLQLPEGATLVSFQVHSGDYIDKIVLVYEKDGSSGILSMGGNGGSPQPLVTLNPGEVITSIQGTYGEFVNTLLLVTNQNAYGPWGNINGPISYQYHISSGTTLAGIWGYSGDEVDSVGVILAPTDNP